jgi:hypothetical protein
MDLDNVTQAAVENEVSQQYRAARGAVPRVVNIEGWQDPDPNDDFVRAFYGGRGAARGRVRTGNEVAVKTKKIGTGRVAVFLVPNPGNDTFKNLKVELKVGEAQM